MIQIKKIIIAYETTQDLVKDSGLSINAKWSLFKLRKKLYPHYEFHVTESRNLFLSYKTEVDGNTVTFESVDLANEYQKKQDEIDNFEIDEDIEKIKLKLSDIPGITIPQMEQLEEFVEFSPE